MRYLDQYINQKKREISVWCFVFFAGILLRVIKEKNKISRQQITSKNKDRQTYKKDNK